MSAAGPEGASGPSGEVPAGESAPAGAGSPSRADPGADAAARARWQRRILVAMYCGYAGLMVCRNTLIAASPAMIQDPTLGLDKAGYGRLMSAHSAGSIAGKLVMGPLADVLGGRKTFLLALLGTAVTTSLFGLSAGFFAFLALNFLGQAAKAGGWPAMVPLIGAWYPEDKHGTVWSLISTSSRLGTIAATVGLGYLLKTASWRVAFQVSAVVMLAVTAGAFVFLKERPEDVGLTPLGRAAPAGASGEATDPAGEAAPHWLDGVPLPEALKRFATSWRVWTICGSLILLTVMLDFLTFIPLYLQETLGVAPADATMAASAYPAGSFLSLLGAGRVYDRLSKRQHVWALGATLLGAMACVVGLGLLPRLGLTPGLALKAAMALLFAMGVLVAPSYYIPMSVFAVQYGGPHGGVLVALLDIAGYLGAIVFNYFGGSVAQSYGWPVFLRILMAVALGATFSTVAFLRLEAKAAERDRGR